jgi:poly-gamma-glutamate capsule biosynthesis protein CapA/YwtB (metallophosphatase superfamily)
MRFGVVVFPGSDAADCYYIIDQVLGHSVSLHWGTEYSDYPEVYQKETAHRLVDAGAKLVIGHHPHCLQGVEMYNGSFIAYSLGNFVF